MWKQIEQINWDELSTNGYDADAEKRTVMETFTEETCKLIRSFADDRRYELQFRVDDYEKEHGQTGDYSGDDSYGDMLWHVVGLGEDKFNEVMNDPSVLNGMTYVESFGYVIPYYDDYENMNVEYHKKKALKCIKELTRIIVENNPASTDLVLIGKLMQSLILMRAGDFKGAVKGYTKENYKSFYQFEGNDRMALFINTITTAAKYMV